MIEARESQCEDIAFHDQDLREAFYRAAHDLKGQSATLGFPLVGRVAASLCRLLDQIGTPEDLPLGVIRSHVEAIRAIVRERAHEADNRVGCALAAALEALSEAAIAGQGGVEGALSASSVFNACRQPSSI